LKSRFSSCLYPVWQAAPRFVMAAMPRRCMPAYESNNLRHQELVCLVVLYVPNPSTVNAAHPGPSGGPLQSR
jgi:hypothetical protein